MKWTEVCIKTTEEACEAVSEMLMSIGSGGVAIEDPGEFRRLAENPEPAEYVDRNLDYMQENGTTTEGEVTVRAYFGSESPPGELDALIKEKLRYISRFLDTGKGCVGFNEVDEEDWATSWKKYYKPFLITDGIVVKPSWEEYEAKAGETVIELDPGMAFGTGTHETTILCANLLCRHVRKDNTVIDVGCGTGILSIIAVSYGAAGVFAVDVDEVAVRVARDNCAKNGMLGTITVKKGVLADLEPTKADIVVANITADAVIGLAEQVPGYLKKGGMFLASGIVREREDDVIRAYADKGYGLESIDQMGEWVAMAFICPGSL